MEQKPCRGFTLVQALIVVGILSTLSSVVFPFVGKAKGQQGTIDDSMMNEREICLAGIMYGSDYDDGIAPLINGPYRSLQDVKDGVNTAYGEERTDGWPLLLIPYIKSRGLFTDPTRSDENGIWSGVPLAADQAGYDSKRNTFRNQSRFPFYGVNYLFLCPGVIPQNKVGATDALNAMTSQPITFVSVDAPAETIYFTASKYYGMSSQGFFAVNAPGVYRAAKGAPRLVFFKDQSACGADWCYDADSSREGAQTQTNSAYFDQQHYTPVSFLDGHVKKMLDTEVAAGTDFLSATPNSAGGSGNFGGCQIVDKAHYLWNATENYYGL